MPDPGVPPASPAGPGGSGPQQAAGAPAPVEAQPAAAPLFGSPASGQDNRVPFARFKEVNDRLKGAEAKLAEYEANRAPPVAPIKSPDQLLAEIRQMAKKGADDPDVLVGALEQMVNVRTSSAVNEALRSVFEEQQREAQAARDAALRQDAEVKTLRDFPELQDPNSDLYKATAAIYRADPWLQETPDGVYRAAKEADYNRGKKVARPTPLGAPGSQRNAFAPESDSGYMDDRKAAIAAMREGRMAAVDDFFTKNMDRFLKKPAF